MESGQALDDDSWAVPTERPAFHVEGTLHYTRNSLVLVVLATLFPQNTAGFYGGAWAGASNTSEQ